MVLDKGQIVQFDTPLKLMEQHGSVFGELAKDAGLKIEDLQ